MDSNIQKLLDSILEHQAEIDHDIEMLPVKNAEIEEILTRIREDRQELIDAISKAESDPI
jgi:hypothetical protein